MRLVFGLVLVAGLGLAAFAVSMAQNYIGAYQNALEQERAKATETIPTKQIYVVTRAVEYGEQLTDEDVRLAHYPIEILPEGHFDAEADLNFDSAAPRVALGALALHEAVTDTKISEPGGDAGLTSRLERGQRAFAIKVDVASGVSGFLRPGDLVDIYWTGRVSGNDGGQLKGDVTKLIQTRIRLIAIDQSSQSDQSGATIARTVTVAATPQTVASLAQAQSTGRLALSLMAANDDTVAEAIEVDQRSLLGIERVEIKTQETAQVCTIRTRRGAEVVELPIPCTN